MPDKLFIFTEGKERSNVKPPPSGTKPRIERLPYHSQGKEEVKSKVTTQQDNRIK